jgi:predicted nucleotidyltransferase
VSDTLNNEELIKELTTKITASIHPESIILFGSRSYCHAENNDDSDIDLLVIWNEEDSLSNRERRLKLRHLIGDFDKPLDLLTYTSAELAKALTEPHSFTSQIVREGRIIYGRLN